MRWCSSGHFRSESCKRFIEAAGQTYEFCGTPPRCRAWFSHISAFHRGSSVQINAVSVRGNGIQRPARPYQFLSLSQIKQQRETQLVDRNPTFKKTDWLLMVGMRAAVQKNFETPPSLFHIHTPKVRRSDGVAASSRRTRRRPCVYITREHLVFIRLLKNPPCPCSLTGVLPA